MKKIILILILIIELLADLPSSKKLDISINPAIGASISIEKDFFRFDFIDIYQIDNYKNKKEKIKTIEVSEIIDNQFLINKVGNFKIEFNKRQDGTVWGVWEQDIFVPTNSLKNYEELAKQYMPVVIFNNEEEYFPQSLDNILSFNEIKGDQIKIANTEGGVKVKMGEEIKEYLRYNGHSNASFNFGTISTTASSGNLFLRDSTGSLSNSTIYWDVSLEKNELYLTYYFFYAFDPKNGSSDDPDIGAHAFDRESFTIKFKNQDNVFIPIDVVYAGHLENQDLKFRINSGKDEDDVLVEWSGGKTIIDWKNIIKVGKHPVIYKAKGAHAIYPAQGYYGVDLIKGIFEYEDSLVEEAGSFKSDKILLPNETVSLKKLDLNEMKYLNFSGAWVDVLLTTNNAKFPPFIRRPYSSWYESYNAPADTKSEIEDFDQCLRYKNDTSIASDKCKKIIDKFDYIEGLTGYKAITVEVRDEISDKRVPFSIVKIYSDDSSFISKKTTYSDGTYTFFYTSDKNYKLSVFNGNEEVFCKDIFVDNNFLMKNNQENQVCYISKEENNNPTTTGQTVTLNQDTTKAITLSASDIDKSDTLKYEFTEPKYGNLTGTAPDLIYTPKSGYSGSDSFTFKVNDGKIDSNISTILIIVNKKETENNKPTAAEQSVTLNQDTTKSIILSAIDVDEDELTYIIVSQPSNGTLTGTAPNLTYTPNSGYSGSDSFSFKVNDGKADSNISTISITIDKVINKQITFVSESIPNDGSVVLRGSSFVKSWTFKNSGNVDLSNLKVETVNAASGLTATINQNVSSSLKQNATTTYALNISVPSDLQEGTYEAKYKLTDSSVDLKYSNGGISYFTYKLSVPKPNDFKAYAYLSSSTYSTDENTLLSVVVNDGNKPYQISINWGDGTSLTSAQITNVSEVKNFTYKYSSEGNYVVTTNITDSMGKTAQVKNSITIKNSVDSTTKWSVSGADLITNTNQENLNVQTIDANTHSVYTTSWTPQSVSDDYWITYKLPIPKDLIKMTNKLRVTFVGKAGELEDYDRAITLALSDGKNYSYNFMTNINNGSGFIRTKDYQGIDTKQLVSTLTDSSLLVRQNDRAYAIENNYLGTSSNSTLEAYKFENSSYTYLSSTSRSITASNTLKELQINFKGNGTITLLKLEYDKNGDGNYSSDETIILNTDSMVVDWSSFINTEIEIPEETNTISHNGYSYETVISPTTGRVWLDRNIGASRVCTSATDELCFGDYFQWGRNADGHEKLNSNISTVPATNISNVGHGDFITTSDIYNYDWINQIDSDGSLRAEQWSKTDGSSICPIGFRVPTIVELKAETLNSGINNIQKGYNSFLKLPISFIREYAVGHIYTHIQGHLWSTSKSGTRPYYLALYENSGEGTLSNFAYAMSVRCIEDDSDKIVSENINNTVHSNSLRTPNGGEEWNNGEIETIQWSKVYISSAFVDLYVLNDSSDGLLDKSSETLGNVVNTKKWYKFASKIENNGSYELDPALLNGSGNDYMILIVASDDKTKWDISDGTFSLNESTDSSNDNSIGHNGFVYNAITSSKTGRVWLDRNIGATKVCNSDISDFESYEMYMMDQIDCFGDYYQAKENNGNLNITNWEKSDGTSICPVGFKVPNAQEFFEEITTSSNTVYAGDMSGSHSSFDTNSSFLNLPFSGYKNKDGNIVRSEESLDLFNSNQVSIGSFWTSGQSSNSLYSDKYYSIHFFSDSKVQPRLLMNLENSFNIRCIKNEENGFIIK